MTATTASVRFGADGAATVQSYVRLTARAEALLETGPERADLVPLPGGREVTA